MCLPLAAVGIGLSLAGSAANAAQQSAYAGASNRYQRAISARNQANAQETAVNQYGAIGERLWQENLQTEEAVKRVATDAIAARGRVTAAAADAGVSGNSVDALLNDFSRQEGGFISAARANEKFAQTQAEYEKKGVRMGLDARQINSTPQLQPTPNLFGQALLAFGSAFDTGLRLDSGVQHAGGNSLFF